MITHLLYKSFTSGDLAPKQIQDILEASRTNNERDQLTGILLYRSRTFLQLLEGDEAAISKCMARIRTDRRHYGASTILKVTSDRRIFPQWQMGFIPEAKIIKPFDSLDVMMKEGEMGRQPDRKTVVAVIRSFVASEEDLPPHE